MAASARAGPSCCSRKGKVTEAGLCLALASVVYHLRRFVFDIQRKSIGLDTRFYDLLSLCPRLWKKYKKIIVFFMGSLR